MSANFTSISISLDVSAVPCAYDPKIPILRAPAFTRNAMSCFRTSAFNEFLLFIIYDLLKSFVDSEISHL